MADVKELNVNNTTYDIKAKSVVDTNSGKLFFWSGTKNQFDAIASKDANTLYNITDDTDVSLTILEALYPVGSIYITTNAACPLSTLIAGSTWVLVGQDRVLQGAGTRGAVGTTLNESLPNIKGEYKGNYSTRGGTTSGALSKSNETTHAIFGTDSAPRGFDITFDASRSSSTYQDNAPVQPDAYLVNIYRRIS